MKKRIAAWIYILLALALCLTPGLGLLINDILGIADPALPVPQLVAHDVTGGFQLPQSITDGVHALLADFRKATGGIVPVIRQRQHHG